MTNSNIVSVIIPTFNREVLLKRALVSLQRQIFRSFDVVVVDDGSEEDIIGVVASLDDPRFRVVANDKKGAAAARNFGAMKARGRYLTFLDSDDEAYPHWLEKMNNVLQAQNAEIVCCGSVRINSDGQTQKQGRVRVPGDLGVLFGNAIGHFTAGSFAVSRSLFEEVGGFDDTLPSGHHTDLGIRLLRQLQQKNGTICSILEPLIKVHIHDGARIRNDYQAVYTGTTRLLDKHSNLFSQCPKTYSLYHGVAAVNAVNLGMFREARYHFRRSAMGCKTSPKAWARFIVSLVPGGMQLLWGRSPRSRLLRSA